LVVLLGTVSILATWSCATTKSGTDKLHRTEPTIATLPSGQDGVAVVFVNEYGSSYELPALRVDGLRLALRPSESKKSRSSYGINLPIGKHFIETETSTGAKDWLEFEVTKARIWIVAIYWGPRDSGNTPAVELFATHEAPAFQ
jgi:hypothetical protein